MTFLAAAERVLGAATEPLTVSEITSRALAEHLVVTQGATPAATMESQLAVSIQRDGEASPFVRVGPRTYGLRQWVAEGRISVPVERPAQGVRVPHYPHYAEVRALLPILDGLERGAVTGMRSAIWEHTGTVEDSVSWTDPDSWIPERLTGTHRETALRIWRETKHLVNPRHMTGHWLLVNQYDLVGAAPDGRLSVTPAGQDFLDHPDGAVVQRLDENEGLVYLLTLLAERGSSAVGALMDPWMVYLLRVSNVRAESTARSFLQHRLRNLTLRGLTLRSGIRYESTPNGLAYIRRSPVAQALSATPAETERLRTLVAEQRTATREALRQGLAGMDPYAFEYVVKRLLEEMGYVDVEVTARSGDRGVDVLGRIALGITEVREVVQVKRQGGTVQRPVLDQLRGSLHRFDAVRGTIIALGRFGKGIREAAVERGAAPITLIDGDKLLDLLIEHEVGVHKKVIETLELDVAPIEKAAAREKVDEA